MTKPHSFTYVFPLRESHRKSMIHAYNIAVVVA